MKISLSDSFSISQVLSTAGHRMNQRQVPQHKTITRHYVDRAS